MSNQEKDLRPLCYDPERDKFIYREDLKSGKEKIVPLEKLNHEQIKKLVIERYLQLPPNTKAVFGFKVIKNRDEMIREIEDQTDIGKEIVKGEIFHIEDQLKDIEETTK